MNLTNRHKIISLRKKNEIDIVFNRGKKIRTQFGPIFLYKDMGDKSPYRKVAILLKKNIGSAVKRNYIKRIIRNFIIHHQELLVNFNRMIFLFNSDKNVSYSIMEKEYLRALEQ